MHVIVYCFSRLSACSLGCYGNFQSPTPSFDRLAARSIVCDSYYVSPDSPLRIEQLLNSGFETIVADDEEVTPDALAQAFCELKIESANQDPSAALASLPVQQQQQITIAASLIMKDRQLKEFLIGQQELIESQDLFLVTSLNGDERFVCEDHPDWMASVSEPMVHLPLFIVPPQPLLGRRWEEFVIPEDVLRLGKQQTLEEWRDGLDREELSYASTQARCHRSKDWLLVEKKNASAVEEDEGGIRLFRLPEDRWQMLDVGRQHPQMIDRFRQSGTLLPDPPE